MNRKRRDLASCIAKAGVVLVLLVFCTSSALAQKTVEQNAGGGRKLQMDYNAAGQVTEMRSLGPDGKLQQKTDYVYQPGFMGPQETTTSYWPNGKMNKVTRVTYDQSSNFTGEFIQVYDESGKQILGHRLTHDPMTGIYTCADWDVAAQDYKRIECPAGEESGGAEELKKFTYEEVMQLLSHARQTAQQQHKQKRMLPMTPVKPPITTDNKEVGFILPAQVRPGERISGSVVEDPANYDGMPGVIVTRIPVPFSSVGEASKLWGWNIELPGEKPQPADGPVTFVVPSGAKQINVTVRQQGSPDQSVSKAVTLSPGSTRHASSKSFQAPALCMKDQLCTVSGPFSGDSTRTFAAFQDQPAAIVAETPEFAYIGVPAITEAGQRPLLVAEGSKVIAFPVAVGNFFVKNVERKLEANQTLITFPTLEGPGDIPDSLWRPGNYPASNLEQARALIPGFQVPREDHAAREKREAEEKEMHKKESKEQREAEEKKGGMLLLVLKNMTPDQISMRGAKEQMIVFRLNDEAFTRGEFKYDLVVEALKPGSFMVKGYVIPFLAPVTGQEFQNKETPPVQ